MAEHPIPSEQIFNRVYKGPNKTGDTADVLGVLAYSAGADLSLMRQPLPLVDIAYDYSSFTNPDANGNYQTVTFKAGGSGGTTVRTLTFTYDGSNNITSIERA